MKIYLAIPYSGVEEESFRVANKTAGQLMLNGHQVFSPISHTHPISMECELPGDWKFWSAYDECFIRWCDELWVAKFGDWRTSKGVKAEIKIACELGKFVRFMYDFGCGDGP